MKNEIIGAKFAEDILGLFYIGQMGFIVKYKEKYIMIDGYLSDYVDKNCCDERVKWVRKYCAPIKAEELDFIDYVFCTHAHFDHADPETLSTVARINKKAKYIVSAGISNILSEYGVNEERIISVKCDERVKLCEDIYVTAVPAAHEELHIDEHGSYMEVGFKFELGNIKLFHSGDCCPYDGLEKRLEGTDILIMPVNGRNYFKRYENDIIGCFDSEEALTIAERINAKLLIPCHIDLYEINGLNPAYFTDCWNNRKNPPSFHIFKPGEKYLYQK